MAAVTVTICVVKQLSTNTDKTYAANISAQIYRVTVFSLTLSPVGLPCVSLYYVSYILFNNLGIELRKYSKKKLRKRFFRK